MATIKLSSNDLLSGMSEISSTMADFLSEFYQDIGTAYVNQRDAIDALAEAYLRGYEAAAESASRLAQNAYSNGNDALGNFFDRVSDAIQEKSSNAYTMSGESYALRETAESLSNLKSYGKFLGNASDSIEIGIGILEGFQTGNWNTAERETTKAIGSWAGAALVAALLAASIGTGGLLPAVLIGLGAVGGSYLGDRFFDRILQSRKDLDAYYESQSKNSQSNTYRIVWLSADPLTLDLDGDGIETTAVNGATGALFDHNNDGIATATGWLNSDDGFLVRDINGNGIIDTGAELFGDSTLLSDGNNAANGFAALADLDTIGDGVVNASDAAFSRLRVWRDLNQDGVSQADELFTLEQQGIQSLATAITSHADITLPGGVQAETGSYTRLDADGNPVTTVMADVNLRQDPFYSQYTDSIPVPEELLDLPNLPGMGRLRNLQEAAALSPALADVLTQYAAAQTRMEQRALLDQVLLEWAKTDPLYTEDTIQVWFSSFGGLTYDENSTNVVYLLRGQSVGVVLPTVAEPELLHRTRVLDAVLGREITTRLNEGYASQVSRTNRGYDALADAVYNSLLTQTRLKKYLDSIDLLITEDSIQLDLSGITTMFRDKIASDPVNGITDLIEFNKVAGDLLRGTQWDGYAMLEETLRTQAVTPELQEVFTTFDVRFNGAQGTADDDITLGNETDRTIYGENGDDVLLGGSGNEVGNDNDVISGGAGNDTYWEEAVHLFVPPIQRCATRRDWAPVRRRCFTRKQAIHHQHTDRQRVKKLVDGLREKMKCVNV